MLVITIKALVCIYCMLFCGVGNLVTTEKDVVYSWRVSIHRAVGVGGIVTGILVLKFL